MKTKSFYIRFMKQPLVNLLSLLFFLLVACDSMKTELDITSIAFPPKLSVTAILDNEKSSFSIVFSEGRALADYAKPFPDNREIIRDGEIRLYEDDRQIWRLKGPFNLSVGTQIIELDGVIHWKNQKGYSHVEYGIATCAGSEYRLEVEVEGYETVISAAIMPEAPVTTASVDASSMVKKDNIYHIGSLNEYPQGGYNEFWPLSVQFTDPAPNERKYYALDIFVNTEEYLDDVYLGTIDMRSAIGVAELSKLQDNPDVEAEELLMDTNPADMYLFLMMLQSNITFSAGNNTLTYYIGRPQYQGFFCSDDFPFELPPNLVSISTRESYSLRVKSITTESFKYYRSLALQNAGMGFFSEPVTIVGNIEKGYGCFSVINSVNIPVLELENCYLRPNHGN